MPEPTRYISTRGQTDPVSFQDAVLMGLATDGGLLLPEAIPQVTERLATWERLDYASLASAVMRLFIGRGDISDSALSDLVSRSYAQFSRPEVVPLQVVGPLYILELFHGPTLAFKDIALQFLGNLFEHILSRTGRTLNVVGATSGDTGSAAIAGIRGRANMHIFIMHPRGRVSPVQERQMTTVLDDNVHNIALEGTFDDGQRILKEMFSDIPFRRRYHLGAVNSLNWARILAQIVYYFTACFEARRLTGADRIQACVPTGNFGDILAGYLAKRMGAPIDRLILATNENDILSRFFRTGVYCKGEVRATLSPSMDIQIASNFERYLFYRVGKDPGTLRALMREFAERGAISLDGTDPSFVADSGTREDTLAAIQRYYTQYGYLLDPHTAVGVSVAERFLRVDAPTVCLATAHPAKFGGAIRDALGSDVATHPSIDQLADLPTRCTALPARREAVQAFIANTLN